MRAGSIARFSSRRTRSASSASASTRCRMRSRSLPSSACSTGSMRSRSAPTSCSTPTGFGQEIWREPRGLDAGYDVPQFSIHRGRLQGVIYQAARARLGESRIHPELPARLLHPGRRRRHRLFLRPHRRTAHTARGDVLIGADGIHSLVRETLFPNEGPPRWNGIMLWRGADRLAGLPHRALDGRRRRPGGQARDLSDRRRARGPTKG